MKMLFKKVGFRLGILFVLFFLDTKSYGASCGTAGQLHYNGSTTNIELCDGSNWKTMSMNLGNGTSCHWEYWGSGGQGGNGFASLYSLSSASSNPQHPESGAYCQLGEYIAGMVGEGVTTGGKRDFGWILCCPSGTSSTSTATSTSTSGSIDSSSINVTGNVTATDSSSISVSWSSPVAATAVISVGTSATDTNPTLYPSDTDTPSVFSTSTTSYVIPGLQAGTTYYITIDVSGTSSGTGSVTLPPTTTAGTGSSTSTSTSTSTTSSTDTSTSTATGGSGGGGGKFGGGGGAGSAIP